MINTSMVAAALLWIFSVNVYHIEHANSGDNKYLQLILSKMMFICWKRQCPVITNVRNFCLLCLHISIKYMNNTIKYFNHINPVFSQSSTPLNIFEIWFPALFNPKNTSVYCSDRHEKQRTPPFIFFTVLKPCV